MRTRRVTSLEHLDSSSAFDARAAWTRQPMSVKWDGAALSWTCHPITDFWREAADGFASHNGSACLQAVDADFELLAHLSADLRQPLDQVGVFVERNAQAWLKAGLELDDGQLWLSAVHTQGASDQSRERWEDGLSLQLRVCRQRDVLSVSCIAAEGWHTFRTIHCSGPLGVGVYSCAPQGDGFAASAVEIELR